MKKLNCILLCGLGVTMIACATNQKPQDTTSVNTIAKKSLLPAKIPTVVDNAVFFPLNSSNVSKTYYGLLKYNASYLISTPDAKIILVAYATESRDSLTNKKLAEIRVNNVRKYLIENGVATNQMTTKLLQETHQDNPHNVVTKNQRVDILYTNESPVFYSYTNKPIVELP
jgi:outer membrane protein OmpA-like peptidoglycan-associated protein